MTLSLIDYINYEIILDVHVVYKHVGIIVLNDVPYFLVITN